MAIAYQSNNIIEDRYRITGILGKGGVAITYRAIDLETNTPVAIKVISLKQLDNWKQIKLFQREAEVLAKLDHPAIPKYIDYFDIETETDKAFYLVQQIASGKSLFELVENGWRTNEAEVKKIARQVLEILAYLHSLEPPVIHRDIKPNNLIRSDDGTIYLVDFGAVQNTYYNTLMQGSTVVGTYGYMAPEQFRGKAVPATDLYSLGATLLYLLTHRSPAELPQDTLKLDFRSSVKISDSFADWLEKLLEPDLDDRFASAEIALAKLLSSNKVKSRKLFVSIVTGTLCLASIWGFTSYRWFFLSRLSFYPSHLCSDSVAMKNYFYSGGKTDIKVNTILNYNKRPLLNCVIDSQSIKEQEKIELIDLLIESGADINAMGRYDYTLLSIAVKQYESINVVRLLLEYGADVNAKAKDGTTPLFNAVRYGNYLDVTKLLIENGANINIREQRTGKTPLIIAISNNNIDTAKLLINNGANVNIADNSGRSPLFIAAHDAHNYDKNIALIEFLIKKGANIEHKNEDGNNIFFYMRNKALAQMFLDFGLDVNHKNNRGRNPLFSYMDSEVAQLLIDNGAEVSLRDEKEKTPLFTAISNQDNKMVKLLIDNGADVNLRDKTGKTPLLIAINYKNIDAIKLLIENGVVVNFPDSKGRTPLDIAISQRKEEIASLLLSNGANANYSDDETKK